MNSITIYFIVIRLPQNSASFIYLFIYYITYLRHVDWLDQFSFKAGSNGGLYEQKLFARSAWVLERPPLISTKKTQETVYLRFITLVQEEWNF